MGIEQTERSEGIFSIQVEKSDSRKGAKGLLIPGFNSRPQICVEMFEDLEVWVHEFSEIAVIEWLKNTGYPEFTHDIIDCSIFGLHKHTSLAHLLTSLHTISYLAVKKRLRRKLIRLSAEDFANNILLGDKTHE